MLLEEVVVEVLDVFAKTIAPSASSPITTATTTRFEPPDFLDSVTAGAGAAATWALATGFASIVLDLADPTGTGGTTILVAADF